mgnify:CR=1 FL=1
MVCIIVMRMSLARLTMMNRTCSTIASWKGLSEKYNII